MKLPHIFSYTAVFEDNTVLTYNHLTDEDISQNVENGSRFSDVMQKSKESKLISFVLHNADTQIGVDLRDGHFELNGNLFFQHRPDTELYSDFRIIYYRTCVLTRVVGEEDAGHIRQYVVGWQANDENGNNVQRIIAV